MPVSSGTGEASRRNMSDSSESRLCQKCGTFYGTAATSFLCSSCFAMHMPDEYLKVKGAQQQARRPVLMWKGAWADAVAAVDRDGLQALVRAWEGATGTGSATYRAHGEDMDLPESDADECARVMKETIQSCIRKADIDIFRALHGAGAIQDPRECFDTLMMNYHGTEKHLALLKEMLDHENYGTKYAHAITGEHLTNVLYYSGGNQERKKEFLHTILEAAGDSIVVTQKHVKDAKYLLSRTNGGVTKPKKELVGIVEGAYKARQKRMAAERKRSREESASTSVGDASDSEEHNSKRLRSSPRDDDGMAVGDASGSEGDAAGTCKQIGVLLGNDMNFLTSSKRFGSSSRPEVWTCGLHITPGDVNHNDHVVDEELTQACDKMRTQMGGFVHDIESVQVFIASEDELNRHAQCAGDSSPVAEDLEAEDIDELTRKFCEALDGEFKGEPGVSNSSVTQVVVKTLSNDRKCFFHRRFYNDGWVKKKELAKVKAATNTMKRLIEKNSARFLQFHNAYLSVFDPRMFIIAPLKKKEGYVLVVSFVDMDQEHYHHGS